jgi:class 3 adenylate cyclase
MEISENVARQSRSATVARDGSAPPWAVPRAAPPVLVHTEATILFTDIVGFTPMTEELGDRLALDVLRAHNCLLREEIRVHAGREVRFQGDGFMVAFASPLLAVDCAIAMQRTLADPAVWTVERTIRIRIGIHTGEVILDDRALHGRTVILAARIAAQARGGEVLVSSHVKERVGEDSRYAFDAGRETELKGLRGQHRIYRVLHDASAPHWRTPMFPLRATNREPAFAFLS